MNKLSLIGSFNSNAIFSGLASVSCAFSALDEMSTLKKVSLIGMSIFCAFGSAGFLAQYLSSHSIASIGYAVSIYNGSDFQQISKFFASDCQYSIIPENYDTFLCALASVACLYQAALEETLKNSTPIKITFLAISFFNALGIFGVFENYLSEHTLASIGFTAGFINGLKYLDANLLTVDKLILLGQILFNEVGAFFSLLHNIKYSALSSVQINGLRLGLVSPQFRGDREFVLEAVRQNGTALRYAKIELRDDRELVLEAVRQNGKALQFASIELRDDRDIVSRAVENYPPALRFASRDIIFEYVQQDCLLWLRYLDPVQRSDRDLLIPAIRQNINAIQYASPELVFEFLTNLEFLEEHFYRYVANNLCTIDGIRYFPKPLSQELREIQLPELSQGASINHLKQDLSYFIDELARYEDRLEIIRQQLSLPNDITLQQCKDLLRLYHDRLFDRLENRRAYLGTPPEGTLELTDFYQQLEDKLVYLDAFFSKEQNQLPEAFIERLQLLYTQEACGARFQGEVDQLFSLNCMSTESMHLDKQLALMLSLKIKKIIESITPGLNVHEINIKTWLLHPYLVGGPVVRDHLALLPNIKRVIRSFLRNHTSVSIVEAVQRLLQEDQEIEKTFIDYVVEDYEMTESDWIEIEKEIEQSWQTLYETTIERFEQYQKAKAGNNTQLLRLLDLPQEIITCHTQEQLNALLEQKKVQSLESIRQRTINSYKTEKIYAQYYEGDIDSLDRTGRWRQSLIARVLEKMGLLTVA